MEAKRGKHGRGRWASSVQDILVRDKAVIGKITAVGSVLGFSFFSIINVIANALHDGRDVTKSTSDLFEECYDFDVSRLASPSIDEERDAMLFFRTFLAKREQDNIKEALKCVRCDKDRAATFLPCGHFIMCLSCADLVDQCPICNKEILAIAQTFMA